MPCIKLEFVSSSAQADNFSGFTLSLLSCSFVLFSLLSEMRRKASVYMFGSMCSIFRVEPPSSLKSPTAPFPGFDSDLSQAAARAILRRHCFSLCLPVSNGNCTTKSLCVWNFAWGCFGYIEVFLLQLCQI